METATTIAVAARLRTLCRIGFSTREYETHDRRNAPTTRPSFTVADSSDPAYWTARISTGQCQRYRAYERSPTTRIGRSDSSRATDSRGSRSPVPATIASAAPIVGSSAR